MTRKVMTVIGLALGPLLLLLADGIFAQTGPGGPFIDFFGLLRATAVVAWPVGVLLGHWYGPSGMVRSNPGPLHYILLIGASAAVMGLSLFFLNVPGASDIVSTVSLCAGMVVGALFWPVEEPRNSSGD